MPTFKSRSSWLAMLVLVVFSSVSHAGLVGTHTAKGVVNVTFMKAGKSSVKTVANSEQTWVFNANNTFFRDGVITGNWKRRSDGMIVANYNRNSYIKHLNGFWANLGVIASNIRILENKLLIRGVSNGLSIEETLDYRMNVSENGGTTPVRVVIKGSAVVANETSENPALRKIFPTMWQGQDAIGMASSVEVTAVNSVYLGGDRASLWDISASSYTLTLDTVPAAVSVVDTQQAPTAPISSSPATDTPSSIIENRQ